MFNIEKCRTIGNKFGKPTSIILNSLIVSIDYTFDALYWAERLEEELTGTATDRDGHKYNIFSNDNKGFMIAIPVE